MNYYNSKVVIIKVKCLSLSSPLRIHYAKTTLLTAVSSTLYLFSRGRTHVPYDPPPYKVDAGIVTALLI